jgi:hypothetical protein
VNVTGHISLPGNPRGSDILVAKGVSGTEQTRRPTDPDLQIAEDIFDPAAVRGLIDEWLVPAIVDSLIQDFMNSSLQQER